MAGTASKTGFERLGLILRNLNDQIRELDLAATEETGDMAAWLYDQRDMLIEYVDELTEKWNEE